MSLISVNMMKPTSILADAQHGKSLSGVVHVLSHSVYVPGIGVVVGWSLGAG